MNFDFDRLSPRAQAHLRTIAGQDGRVHNLTSADLAGADEREIDGLVEALSEHGYDGNEQELVRIILELTRDRVGGRGQRQFGSYDFPHGRLTFGDSTPAPAGAWHMSAVRDQLVNRRTIHAADQHNEHRYASSFLNNDRRLDNALDARRTLASRFGFDVDRPFDLTQIEQLRGRLSRTEIPQFIGLYMSAFYEHSGIGMDWSDLSKQSPEFVFFGPPGLEPLLDQLPDGRRIIDCQGFSKLAEMLFDRLVPGRDSGRVFYMPINSPTHSMGLLRDGDRLYVVDNNQVREIRADAAELAYLERVVEAARAEEESLDGETLSPALAPAVYRDILGAYPHWDADTELEFDEGDTLNG